MNNKSIYQTLYNYIKEEFIDSEKENLDKDSLLITSGIIDSISVLQLVDFIEETFKIEFHPHEVDHDNLNSIQRMITFIETKKSEN